MDILCVLWNAPKRGQKTISLAGWSRELGVSESEMSIYILDLKMHGVGKFFDENHEQITIISRRMVREERIRRLAARRQQKQRDKPESRTESRDRHGNVTGIYQNQSQNQSQKSELREEKKEEEIKTRVLVKRESKPDDDFEIFWRAYPKKKQKKAAFKEWEKAKDRPPLSFILSALEREKLTQQWLDDAGKYIPYPERWIKRGSWLDEPTEINGMSDPNGMLAGINAFLARR